MANIKLQDLHKESEFKDKRIFLFDENHEYKGGYITPSDLMQAAKSVSISGESVFKYSNTIPKSVYPLSIQLFGNDSGIEEHDRSWYYRKGDEWYRIKGSNTNTIKITPDSHMWSSDLLDIRYVNGSYSDQKTIVKLYDGEDSFNVEIHSTSGEQFKNGIISTDLEANVYKGGIEITDHIEDSNFHWTKKLKDGTPDVGWNNQNRTGQKITITRNDVSYKAVFDCLVHLNFTNLFT